MNSVHKKVQVVTVRNNNRSLLLLEMKADRGFGWQNVTGSVDENEELQQAALRELKEETGINASAITQLKTVFKFHDRWGKDVMEYCFLATTNQSDITISKQEHQSFKWVPIDQVTKENFKYESNFQAFQEALSCLD